MTKEEYRKLFEEQRKERNIRLENRSFSEYHNKLVANLYMSPNRLKQQAEKAKHEENIKKWITKLKQIQYQRKLRYGNQKSHFIVVRKLDKTGKLYDFATNPLNATNKKVIKIVKDMITDYAAKTDEFINVVAFTRQDYFKRLNNEGPWKNIAFESCNTR